VIGEIVGFTALIGGAWSVYQLFFATKLKAHVKEDVGGALLVVENIGRSTALLVSIEAYRPTGSLLAPFDHIDMWISGSGPSPVTREPQKVPRIALDIEVAPGKTETYSFKFFSRSSATSARIKLAAWESSLVTHTRQITIPITPKAVIALQKSDIA
jgi:hypothetical protein